MKMLLQKFCTLGLITGLLLTAGCQDRQTPYGKLDARAATVLDYFYAHTYNPDPSVAELRRQIDTASRMQGRQPRIYKTDDIAIDLSGRSLPARIYLPGSGKDHPVLVYYHGGGWVRGDIDTHDIICARICRRTKCIVLSVAYRRAPEHPFPAAVEDAYDSLVWVTQNAASFGGDPGRLAVAGDSAGGNLAAVTALTARDRSFPKLAHQVLIYPVTNVASMDTQSHKDFAAGYMLERKTLERFRDLYLPEPADRSDLRASPLLSPDLSGVAPATVIVAGFDVLRDEGIAYAERLKKAGVAVDLINFEGMIHGFISLGLILDEASDAIAEISENLAEAFEED